MIFTKDELISFAVKKGYFDAVNALLLVDDSKVKMMQILRAYMYGEQWLVPRMLKVSKSIENMKLVCYLSPKTKIKAITLLYDMSVFRDNAMAIRVSYKCEVVRASIGVLKKDGGVSRAPQYLGKFFLN